MDAAKVRAADMAQRYRDGQTLHEIGTHYGITRERVRQILAKVGVTSDEGGARVRKLRAAARRRAEIDERFMKRLGCTFAQYRAVCGHYGKRNGVMDAYVQQRNSARRRGIAWEFTFWSWWQVWEKSGKWAERGRGGYVMARPGDTGPYAPHNVEIITHSQNSSDSRKNHPLGFVKAALRTLGKGKGYSVQKDCPNRPYSVMVRAKHYGFYATAEEATSVYRRVCAQLKREMRAALKRAA